MANYATQCRRCGIWFSKNTATDLCYDCLEKELMSSEEALQGIKQTLSEWQESWKFKAFEKSLTMAEAVNEICRELANTLTGIGFKEQELEQEQKARQQAEADNAYVIKYAQDLCDWAEIWATGSPDNAEENLESMFNSAQQLKWVMSRYNPGSALLAELEQYKKALENIIHTLESDNENMDIAAKKIAEMALAGKEWWNE